MSMKHPNSNDVSQYWHYSHFGPLLSWNKPNSIMVPWDGIMVHKPLKYLKRVKAGYYHLSIVYAKEYIIPLHQWVASWLISLSFGPLISWNDQGGIMLPWDGIWSTWLWKAQKGSTHVFSSFFQVYKQKWLSCATICWHNFNMIVI